MKTEELMTRNVKYCWPENNLSEAAALMWEYDCGALPVVDREKRVMGMITDRDIAIATATKGRLAREINVREVMSRKVHACAMNEDITNAIKLMMREKVRRLPVISGDGKLVGILSINDIALRAEQPNGKRTPEISYDDVMSAFKAVCEHSKSLQAAG